ncbi:MAG: phospholipid carrier-dependent glycosyltransferase [Syntrophaceae bacterium]|nr:phospholipid carrier-dependent glycosyltransferase [Syntrophaceae bacterium]
MACTLAGILAVEVLLCLLPPASRDALIHHLAIPKLWIRHGGFYEIPWSNESYFPMNIDLLYLVPLAFGCDVVPALIHMLFGWGTGYLVYRYLRRHEGRMWAFLGLLIFASTPMVMRLSVTAYVDLGMVFFTTASVLSYVRWRDGGYGQTKWLLLSAVCMGLAAGTKYNAFIPWVVLNGTVCFLYARDTGRQLQAVQWGGLFFVVALAVVSPWLLKNLMLKGNPVYPLLDGLFTFIHGGREPAAFLVAGDAGQGGFNIFRSRLMMYGEEAWQILLLPVRIFFEGRDHSPQHFDGVLNPLLALAAPFAFAGGRKGHRGLFLAFIAAVFCLTALTADLRIRYILSTLPFMTILAVMGIRNAVEWLRARRHRAGAAAAGVAAAGVAVLIVLNLVYLGNLVAGVGPMPYILGEESRDEFLSRQVGSYRAVAYINRNLPQDAVVCLLYLSGRGYYLERDYIHHAGLEAGIVKAMARFSADPAAMSGFLKSLGGSHLLVQEALLAKALEDNIPAETLRGVRQMLAESLVKLYESNGHAVYWIR